MSHQTISYYLSRDDKMNLLSDLMLEIQQVYTTHHMRARFLNELPVFRLAFIECMELLWDDGWLHGIRRYTKKRTTFSDDIFMEVTGCTHRMLSEWEDI